MAAPGRLALRREGPNERRCSLEDAARIEARFNGPGTGGGTGTFNAPCACVGTGSENKTRRLRT